MLAIALVPFLTAATPVQQSTAPLPAQTRDQGRKRDDDGDDDDDEGQVRPDAPIVVTGRRLDAARTGVDAALGATTYTLTNATVENRPGGETGSIAAILTQAPGVSAAGDRLVVRGATGSQVRINDVIIPETIGDPAERLSSRLAESVRLLTGALPAQFGAAPGGVVSVTTKNGRYQHGGQAELFAGSDGALEPALEWAGAVGSTSLFASGSIERGRSDIADATGVRGRAERHAVEGLAFADHAIDDENRFSVILGGGRERRRITRTGLGPGTEHGADGFAVGAFQHSAGGASIQAALFAGLATDRAAFARASREHRTTVGAQIDASQRLSAAHTVRLGLLAARATNRESDGTSAREDAARTAVGLYAQDQWTLAPALTFNPGVRVEWLRGLGAAATLEPRASLVWSADEDWSLHLGYARYAAAPALGQGGAALPDERNDYLDAGVQGEVGPLRLGASVYRQALCNLLAVRARPGSTDVTSFAFARGRRRGMELFGSYVQRGTIAWANLAISRATGHTILGGETLFAPATLAAAAARPIRLETDRPITASGGVTRRLGKLRLSAQAELASGTLRTIALAAPNGVRGPAQLGLGLAAVYRTKLADIPFDFRLDLTNLADTHAPTRSATGLEGGWTIYPRQRAVTFGVEAGF